MKNGKYKAREGMEINIEDIQYAEFQITRHIGKNIEIQLSKNIGNGFNPIE